MENERKVFPENPEDRREYINPEVNTPPVQEEVPEEVIKEENDKPAANTVFWAIVIAILIMILIYYFVFRDQDVVSDTGI